MEISTGIDLIEVDRVARSMRNPRFLERVYAPKERELLAARKMNPQTAAAQFAAKEAFSKALGTGIRGFTMPEVAVLRDPLGKPYLELYGNALELAQRGGWHFSVSLTHTKAYAAAVVVGYVEDDKGVESHK